ncbi:MAG: LON peptidase substrate-binding domain-containing protein [Gammaproteobacteria bacterium]|nr:LON peptidase substrate-binding domain-containing protein [Gammaproteobacteria bacterium]
MTESSETLGQVLESAPQSRAVFPLRTVLFPGAVMQLVIFEPRYLDMVSNCLSNQIPFIVCRMIKGNEVGQPAEYDPIGTFAHIIDFDKRADGVLTIKVQGGLRVCVADHKVLSDGLIVSEQFRLLPEVEDIDLPEETFPLQDLLSKLAKLPEVDITLEPVNINSAEYVVHQLAQLLPIELEFKQFLLEQSDAYDKCLALFDQLLEESGEFDDESTDEEYEESEYEVSDFEEPDNEESGYEESDNNHTKRKSSSSDDSDDNDS